MNVRQELFPVQQQVKDPAPVCVIVSWKQPTATQFNKLSTLNPKNTEYYPTNTENESNRRRFKNTQHQRQNKSD